jgi:apolipoprotein N-acyltransferase
MLTVIQPPIGWAFLAWVAWVPFILACSPNTHPCRLVKVTYVISLSYWLGNLYWVFPITIAGWLAFCFYTAFLWPILALCFRYCRIKRIPLFIATPVLIVGIERMQGLFLGGFFWRFLAHSQYQNTALIQIADIFGAGGVSFLIAMYNGLLAELIIGNLKPKTQNSKLWIKAVLACAAIIAAFAYGRWRIAQSDKVVEQGPIVASLQSNIPQSVKREGKSSEAIFNELLQQSKASIQAGAELIVWPETMVQAVLDPQVIRILDPCHPYKVFDNTLKEHSKDTAYILVGAYGGVPEIKEDSICLAERYNSAFLYTPEGRLSDKRYDKIHLVPFGEVLPLRKTFPAIYQFLMKLKFIPYNFDYSLDYGSEYTIFEMSGSENEKISHEDTKSQNQDISKKHKNSSGLGVLVAENNRIYKFGVIICYEDTVPAIARKFTVSKDGKKQVDWLVNISNDGWFVKFAGEEVSPSAELLQHASVCSFRAVENRIPVVRSVNTGISCLIDSLGRIKDDFIDGTLPDKAMDRTAVAGWFTDRILIDKRISFFSKNGEWLDFCCQACLVLLIIVGFCGNLGLKLKTKASG